MLLTPEIMKNAPYGCKAIIGNKCTFKTRDRAKAERHWTVCIGTKICKCGRLKEIYVSILTGEKFIVCWLCDKSLPNQRAYV